MKVNIFIKNTVVLGVTSIILRTVGILFRIYLSDILGSEGMGLYQLIFSVYIFAATFATSGISTAVTRLIAENRQNGKTSIKKIMRVATFISLSIAFTSTAIIFCLAQPISQYLLKDLRAVLPLKILSFSLPFMGVSSCIRGYFIAHQKTTEPSMVQLLEQAVRIAVIMITISIFAPKSITSFTAAVLFGDTVAEAVSFLANWMVFKRDSKKLSIGNSIFNTFKKIMHIALPLSCSAYLSSGLHTIESLLVPERLKLFYNNRQRGLELFGAVRGMALPILFFPASFLTSLSTTLIPEVSAAAVEGNRQKVKRTVESAVSVTLVLSTFIASIFMFNANEIGRLIYSDKDVGQIILILSPLVPFMYLESVTVGLLKGLDCQNNLLKYNLWDSFVRIALVYITLSRFGIKAYLGIMIISNCFSSVLSLRCLMKQSELEINLRRWVMTPLLVGSIGGAVGNFAVLSLHNIYLKGIVSMSIQTIFGLICWLVFKRNLLFYNKIQAIKT